MNQDSSAESWINRIFGFAEDIVDRIPTQRHGGTGGQSEPAVVVVRNDPPADPTAETDNGGSSLLLLGLLAAVGYAATR